MFSADSGHGVIKDFDITWFRRGDEDKIELNVDGVDSKKDLLRFLEKDRCDLVFEFDDETSLRVENTSL